MGELVCDRCTGAGVIVPRAVEPARRASWSALLSASAVDCSVGQLIRPSRRGDLRIAVERRQSRQRAVEAVVAASDYGGAAVVDEAPIWVIAGVCTHRELIAITQCVFDILLVAGIFDGREPLLGFHSGFGGIAEGGVGVGGGYAVTEHTEFVGVEAGVVGHRRGEAEMQPEVVGEVCWAAVDRPIGEVADSSAGAGLDVRVGGVAGEFDIDKQAVAAEELGCGVEGVVDRVLGVPHEPLEVGGGDILALGEVDSH